MKTMKTLSARSRGSALLIVLGFLSFMTISAVSFAIFMRIERQASSNYRHTLEARHMLNSALFRAIEEIDSDLRDKTYTVTNNYKFPLFWKNRIRTSAVEDEDDNDQDARVLSLEALSFVPGILVNDVRRYGVRYNRSSSSSSAINDEKWMGAKWRKLSMPVPTLGDSSGNALSADGQAVVGRYAYVCVNLSDMLNVNECTNHVCLTQLFGDDSAAVTKSDAFINKLLTADRRYETLQDFYASMQQRRGSERADPERTGIPSADTPFGSPFHTWVGNGDAGADAGYMFAGKHVLVTEGRAKAEPRPAAALNITLNQPFVFGSDQYQRFTLSGNFLAALQQVFPNNRLPNSANMFLTGDCFATVLADYIDKDSVPRMLNYPCVEMTPMINQVVINAADIQPSVVVHMDNSTTPPKEVRGIQVVGGTEVKLSVELVWPFNHYEKLFTADPHTYSLRATLRFGVANGNYSNMDYQWIDWPNFVYEATFSDSIDVAAFRNNRYQEVLMSQAVGGTLPIKDLIREGNTMFPGNDMTAVSVVCSVLVQVLQDGNTVFVDQVPCMQLTNRAGGPTAQTDQWWKDTEKLYFQTTPINLVTAANGLQLQYVHNSLEIPDPRFNYRAADWVASDMPNSRVDSAENASTTALLGQNGRDADIYMSVANTDRIESPGELGFIIRPFAWEDSGEKRQLMQQTSVATVPDADAMFRTIRLYDHYEVSNSGVTSDPNYQRFYERDPVFDYFYAQDATGWLPGSRVNPLSDIPSVLEAAIGNTPFNYFIARLKKTDQANARFGLEWNQNSWNEMMKVWTNKVMSVRTQLNEAPPDDQDWNKYTNRFSAYYSNPKVLEWYSSILNRKTIYNTALSEPLYEVDRKMLYSYSLDNFCDRQQLFLYILRAEKTGPQLGNDAEVGMRSLAGGRAVALVWRDPYPTAGKTCGAPQFDIVYGYNNDRMAYWSEYSAGQPATPWRQYNLADGDSGNNNIQRRPDLHEHQILFFKQLDN